jgi:hypothetical protein
MYYAVRVNNRINLVTSNTKTQMINGQLLNAEQILLRHAVKIGSIFFPGKQ